MNEKIELQLQRLADGELDRRQLRLMLQQAQRQPELWQAMALAFVENQILQQEIAGGQNRSAVSAGGANAGGTNAGGANALGVDGHTPVRGAGTGLGHAGDKTFDTSVAAAVRRGQHVPADDQVHAQRGPFYSRPRLSNPSWRWWSALAATWLVIPIAYWLGMIGGPDFKFRNLGTSVAQSELRGAPDAGDAGASRDERQRALAEVAGQLDGTRDGNPVLENRRNLPNSGAASRTMAQYPAKPDAAPFSVKLVGQDGADLTNGPIPLYPASMATKAGFDPTSTDVPLEIQRRYNRHGFEVRVQVTQIQLQLDDGREISLPIRNYVLVPIGQ